MRRLTKPAGRYNLVLEDVPVPEPGPTEVRVKAVRSLISRGSEIGRRYTREEAIDPQMMGYSMSGVVDAVGESVTHLDIGDRVVVSAPHADYVVRDATIGSPDDRPLVYPIDPAVDFDAAPYWPLVSGCVTWAVGEAAEQTDTIVIVGQGLVGSLLLQVHKANGIRRVVAVDALDLRCELAHKLGADVVIDASREDPVKAVHKLTSGVGAEIVVYAPSAARQDPRRSIKASTCLRAAVCSTLSVVMRMRRSPSGVTSSPASACSRATTRAPRAWRKPSGAWTCWPRAQSIPS